MFYGLRSHLLALAAACCLLSGEALAFPKVSPTVLQKAGAKVLPCPSFVGSLSGGLSSGIVPRNAMCGSGFEKVKQLKKFILKKTLPLNGHFSLGSAFTEVDGQEGDVQTDPFEVVNYPALIHYDVSNSDFASSFQIAVVNADTGKNEFVFLRSRGEITGDLAWNHPGRFYFKMNGYGNEKEQTQPVFSVSMTFMDQYFGDSISKSDFKDSGIKAKACPAEILDTETGTLYNLGKGFICTKGQDPAEDLTTAAPYNTGSGLFMATDIDLMGAGDGFTLPFRVSAPTAMTYTVSDPTDGKGSTKIFLVDLATGKQSPLVDVRGSIDSTTTSINIPSDYYLYIQTHPSNPQLNGEISWEVSLTGGN